MVVSTSRMSQNLGGSVGADVGQTCAGLLFRLGVRLLLFVTSLLHTDALTSYMDHLLLALPFSLWYLGIWLANLVSFRELVLILVTLMLSRTHSSSQDDLWGISFWHSHPGSSFGSTLLASPLPFPTYLKNYPSKQVPYGCIPMSHHLTYFLAPSSTALKAQEAIAATLRRACNCCLGRH